ncbi:MAG: alanine--tRNA ligase [Candidatus Omnitrophica bacterium]|nr:alanine--tRNA ligase [Candidatus Omnitrophota bacterium]
MKGKELRRRYLAFFEKRGHAVIKSDSLVPADDPTVLFTGAGMNQFKEYFLGKKKDMARATSSQKCLRTGDLDNVGKTAYHHTFFEMLGNFSFGDYFKKEAIQWAWEFLRDDLRIAADKLWVSVYTDDQEAFDIWTNDIGVPVNKIVRLGEKENFWPSNAIKEGPNGPCGPCSEIFFDKGPDKGCGRTDCSPACSCGRFVEIWNLVFTQFNRKEGGILEPLPSKNIDTGMGLERMLSVLQKADTNYDTDLFQPITDAITQIMKEGSLEPSAARPADVHTLCDHIRAITFSICDGVLPSNEERGYVVRMLIRRSARIGNQMGLTGPFLYRLIDAVAAVMADGYPELSERAKGIAQIVRLEEERFLQTLESGGVRLDELLNALKTTGQKAIPGEEAFRLYDTYGFPVELTQMVAQQKGFSVDKAGFERCMDAQRALSRESSSLKGEIFSDTFSQKLEGLFPPTEFIGYQVFECEGVVVGILRGEDACDAVNGPGEALILLDKTVFYPEGGGQTGDRGYLYAGGETAKIIDTKKVNAHILHYVRLPQRAAVAVGQKVRVSVDRERRHAIARNHTATHLLQAALREILGQHIQQAGSKVTDSGLSFDFYHPEKLSQETIREVEQVVQRHIFLDEAVDASIMDIEKARELGALAFFGEKYGEKVRVLRVGGYSAELCGGTHLVSTGQIGSFKIVSESSIASGVRRIEAVTGWGAYYKMLDDAETLSALSRLLKVPVEKLPEAVEALLEKLTHFSKQLKQKAASDFSVEIEEALKRAVSLHGVTLVVHQKDGLTQTEMRSLADLVKGRCDTSVSVIVSRNTPDKSSVLVALTKNLVETKAMDAGALLKELAASFHGKGGGSRYLAQGTIAGSTSVEKLSAKMQELVTRTIRQ